MSLLRVRRRRKKNWIDVKKGFSTGRLVGFLIITVTLIWYLGWRF